MLFTAIAAIRHVAVAVAVADYLVKPYKALLGSVAVAVAVTLAVAFAVAVAVAVADTFRMGGITKAIGLIRPYKAL